MRRFLPLVLLLTMLATASFAQTSLGGKVVDAETKEELIGANVVLYKGGNYATGTSTDFDGNYKISVDPGTYDVEFSYIGFSNVKVTGVVVKAGQSNKLDGELGGDEGITLDDVIVKAYKVPLIEQDNTTSGGVITSEQIRNLPTKNVGALAATTAGLSQADEGDGVTVRGSRQDGTDYYIDGIRVRGSASLIPQTEIDQLQVITGGIEAQYGDVTGGIISITTKGPSSKLSGGFEVETSEFLDDYGYNLLSGNISGPILKKESGESILGYRFSGQYIRRLDDDPPATDILRISDEALAELEANPILSVGPSRLIAAEFLTNDDLEVMEYQPNEESERIDLTGKIDFRLSKAIDMTLTGSFSDAQDRFTPNENNRTGSNSRLFNSHNNPFDYNTRYRANFRFRHRLGKVTDGTEEQAGEEATKSILSNIQYTLQGGFEKRLFIAEDFRHQDNFFAYGHIGQYGREWVDSYAETILDLDNDGIPDTSFISHVDFSQTFTGYSPAETNPVLANYNNGVELNGFQDFSVLNGENQGSVTTAFNFHQNVGQVYNLYQELDEDLTSANVSVSFDINPGGSDKGSHGVKLGFVYEERVDRGYSLNPRNLWITGRRLANNHIIGVDTTNLVGRIPFEDPAFPQYDSVDVFGVDYNQEIVNSTTNLFFEEVRKITGSGIGEYVNVDNLSPDQLSLDLFAFEELNADRANLNLNFYGFDYLGNKLSNDVTFDDFFSATRTVNGRDFRAYPVAGFNPIYFAGYVQDKFQFKDIIFRVGARFDRYDANTKVLRDPYSLYHIQTVDEYYAANPDLTRPEGVDGDFSVYKVSQTGNKVIGFRDGDDWFSEDGNPVNSGAQIFDGPVVPALDENNVNNIRNVDFDPNTSFEDYVPQWNVMPRLAFSFPISEAANFFAHYDILVQRPSAAGINVDRATALNYYNFEETQTAANPNLRPQKTIDYEVGFQQKLSQSSALKIAAYYKELRDMIQRRVYAFLPPPIIQYESFGNLDFGTVKGFTFQYDLRRTNNVQLSANYTLQFADGTGSDANDRQNVANTGILRTLHPLSFDERHRFIGTLDYRYSSGSKYNGPQIGGKDILANFGVNAQLIAVSGRPFTAKGIAEQLTASGTIGQINGSRLPWNTTLNLRVDKSFKIGKTDAKRPLNVNVYLRIQNLLDKDNISRVYEFTGSATDDGFLASPNGQNALAEAADQNREQAFLDLYNARLVNPNFLSLPRRIFLGATFDF